MIFKTQKEMFLHIWGTRDHVSEVSGKPLLNINHFKWHWQLCHILSKGTYPKYKFNSDNIMLMLPEEHEKQETFEAFQNRKQELMQEYYKKYYNKEY